MDTFIEYCWRITPGILLLTVTYLLLPRKSMTSRIFLLIFGFILVRDAMTPMGYWRFGTTEHMLWVRFAEDGWLLLTLGLVSLLLTAFLVYKNIAMRQYILWIGPNKWRSLFMGLAGAVLVLAPFTVLYGMTDLALRGGSVPTALLASLLFMALAGNLMEEVLFRGYLQGYYETLTTPWRAALLSGLLFAAGHIFLASTVTDLGFAVLLFTLYEGLVCAWVRIKHGVLASTLTHGLAIFFLASGLL
ncbi:CPBP family intramembrane glutamic endopeptidase [Paenibacillus daejeonensis]|uniref:CPBP family intramembrane glutamic endopeptidase n=1 Tax=Paenibacillus daejeonensis TaxID=135193 RepID=UPI000382D539|nr:CPBP family intramembrane glutamic endopeptidase [Paenibacillus daejeonensis]